MQLLLIRHALPLRSDDGSDPDLAETGVAQAARLPDALSRFPIRRIISSPQRRAYRTAEPVATALGLTIDVDERLAEYDRRLSHYIPLEQVRSELPEEWDRIRRGELPPAVDVDAFGRRVSAALRDIVDNCDHEDTVAAFSHGGVINVALHQILGTARLLSFPIAYASITLLRYSRGGEPTVAGVNNVEHVWDLLPRNRSEIPSA